MAAEATSGQEAAWARRLAVWNGFIVEINKDDIGSYRDYIGLCRCKNYTGFRDITPMMQNQMETKSAVLRRCLLRT